jgi:hypothetical protein
MTLNNLAVLYKSEGKLDAARTLYRRALNIFENALGTKHPNTIICRTNYVGLREKERARASFSARARCIVRCVIGSRMWPK